MAAAARDGRAAQRATQLTVSAAASLTDALTSCSKDFDDADVRLSFAGSDELAAQIRQGVKPDVYAAANTKLPDQLAGEGLLEKPVVFATNELVIAVPEDSDIAVDRRPREAGRQARDRLRDRAGRRLHARRARRLPAGQEKKILANVRSNEPDVKGVVGKLTQGAADAGFVYRTDLIDGLKAVELPATCSRSVEYGAGVVKGAKEPELAQQYLDGLSDGACADALQCGGFGAAVRAWFPVALAAALAVALAFLTVPVVAIFVDRPPGERAREPRRAGRARRAVAEPAHDGRRAGDHRRSSARRPRTSSPPAASAAARWRSRWSSCRSCCRPRSRASRCSAAIGARR